jgi:hypothetical protein
VNHELVPALEGFLSPGGQRVLATLFADRTTQSPLAVSAGVACALWSRRPRISDDIDLALASEEAFHDALARLRHAFGALPPCSLRWNAHGDRNVAFDCELSIAVPSGEAVALHLVRDGWQVADPDAMDEIRRHLDDSYATLCDRFAGRPGIVRLPVDDAFHARFARFETLGIWVMSLEDLIVNKMVLARGANLAKRIRDIDDLGALCDAGLPLDRDYLAARIVRAAAAPRYHTPKLGPLLAAMGVLDARQLPTTGDLGAPVGRALVDRGLVSEADVRRALAIQLGFEPEQADHAGFRAALARWEAAGTLATIRRRLVHDL